MAMCVRTAPVLISTHQDHEHIPPFFTRSQHPGGEDLLLEYAGMDASAAFWDKGHSRHAHRMLSEFYIGDLREKSTPNM